MCVWGSRNGLPAPSLGCQGSWPHRRAQPHPRGWDLPPAVGGNLGSPGCLAQCRVSLARPLTFFLPDPSPRSGGDLQALLPGRAQASAGVKRPEARKRVQVLGRQWPLRKTGRRVRDGGKSELVQRAPWALPQITSRTCQSDPGAWPGLGDGALRKQPIPTDPGP